MSWKQEAFLNGTLVTSRNLATHKPNCHVTDFTVSAVIATSTLGAFEKYYKLCVPRNQAFKALCY